MLILLKIESMNQQVTFFIPFLIKYLNLHKENLKCQDEAKTKSFMST